ncbi:MAG: O-antigen ligase family protein, partial [Planctomycetota bacterium]
VGSAGAFVGLLAGAYVLLLVSFKKRIIVLAATTILVAAVGAVFWAWPESHDRLLGRRFESTSWVRLYVWTGAADMLSEKPVLGRGAGTFGPVNARYQPTESYLHKDLEKASYYAHSFPLAVACETGLTGLIIIAGVIVFVLWRAQTAVWRDEGARYFLAAGLAPLGAMLAHGAVGVSLYQPHIQVFMWAAIALVLGESTRVLPVPVSPKHTRMTAGRAIRVIAALVVAFGAVALWGRYFTRELHREAAFSRGYFLWKDVLGQRNGHLELERAKGDFAVAMRSPYITIYSLEAQIHSAQVLNRLGEQCAETADSVEAELNDAHGDMRRLLENFGVEKIEDFRNGIEDTRSQARLSFEEAVRQLESVEDTAHAFGDADEKLGFALIELGRFNKDRALVPTEAEGQIRRGCGYLVGCFERNPFGFPRESGTSPPIQASAGGGRGEMVLQALDEHLTDPELLHRLVRALDDAVDIMGARFDELSRKQIEYFRILAHYRDKLSERLWAGEA